MAKYTEWLTDEGLIKIEGWQRHGLIDKHIAQNIGYLNEHLPIGKRNFLPFLPPLKKGKKLSIAKWRMHCLRVLQATNTLKLQKN